MSANLLGRETSPYLLQHKDNPVHWMAWSPEALARARDEDKPILLSVGYSACHWCHVMAHESFENAEIAALMNRLFVSIKVDREERPDIDTIYQSALAMLGEQGGWPLTMFLNPAGEPFWGGTYFPPAPRFGRPGFAEVLTTIEGIYRRDPAKVRSNVASLADRLASLAHSHPGAAPGLDDLDRTAQRLVGEIDLTLGGLRGAPKFPQCALFALLLRAALRRGNAEAARAVMVTCERMCQGGIYDHLGGGFARYATDPLWLVPHFEKMLYDNAQLVSLLTAVWQNTRHPLFAERVRETIAWVLREMLADGGGFAASLDADSEGEEGRFYVWSEEEIEAVLGDDARTFKKAYDVSAGGNWEGVTILNRLRVPRLDDDDEEARLADLRSRLWRHREARPRPGWDDKVLADWNGLMIAALAEAAFAFAEPDWLAAAARAYAFVRDQMSADGRLLHSYRLGRARHHALVEDYANMARAALALHHADGDDSRLADARAWMAVLDAHYWDAEGHGYFHTADDADDLIMRTKTAMDSALPSGNAVALDVLARLALLTGDDAYRDRAEQLVGAFAGQLDNNPLAFASFLNSVEMLHSGTQIVLVGERESAGIQEFLDILRGLCLPTAVLSVIADTAALPNDHPAAGKGQVDSQATAYVCTGQTCSLPITDPAALGDAASPAPAPGQ